MLKKPRLVLCILLAQVAYLRDLVIGKVNRVPIFADSIENDAVAFKDRNIVDGLNPMHFAEGLRFPQILPYVVFKFGSKVFTYSRKLGEEARLHGTRSIGVGGHIDVEDIDGGAISTIHKAMLREVKEEVSINMTTSEVVDFKFLPAILDYTNNVGMVHLGLVTVIELSQEGFNNFKPNTDELYDPQWLELAELKKEYQQYENWSKEIIKSDL